MTHAMTMSDQPVPLDDNTLREALAYYDSYLAFRQRYRKVPGVQAAVLHGTSVVYSAAFGHADVENDVTLTDRHLFRIASHSKTFTATAVMQLVQDGRLRLDDTAGRWVTALVDDSSPLALATVRDLLAHASGVFRDSDDGDFWHLVGAFPDRDRLRAILAQSDAAVVAPNERFKYSNIGYGLLGLIVEAVTGTDYNGHLRTAVVDALGLADLGPELVPDRLGDYAVGYSALAYSDHRVPIEHVDTAALSPATGFYATASDLVTYFSAHFLGDDRLLSDASKRVMQHPVWDTDTPDRRYALGLAIQTLGDRTLIGHGGGYPGHITASLADPKAKLAVSVLTNAIDGPADELAKAAYRLIDFASDRRRPEPTGDLSRFAGRYAAVWGVSDIAVLRGRLYRLHPTLPDPTEDAAELEVVGDDALRIVGGSGFGSYGETIRFTFDPDGSVASIRAESAGTMLPYERFRVPERFTVRPATG
jgi:CubicO group peptidase (beta-lactamase class C family)